MVKKFTTLMAGAQATRIREQLQAIKTDGSKLREFRARQIAGVEVQKIQGRNALSVFITKVPVTRTSKTITNRDKDRVREITQMESHALI
jgi:hypothetical protein